MSEPDPPHVDVCDVILTGKAALGWPSHLIKLAERIIYGKDSPHAVYSHTVLCVGHTESGGPLVAEAIESGMQIRELWEHHWVRDVTILPTGGDMPELDRRQVLAFAHAAVAARTAYGFVTCAALALYVLTARVAGCPRSTCSRRERRSAAGSSVTRSRGPGTSGRSRRIG